MVTHIHGANGRTAKRPPVKIRAIEDRADSLKAAVARNWSALTEDDLDAIKDNLGNLASRLQDRYEVTLDDAREMAQSFVHDLGQASSSAYRRSRKAATRAARSVDKATHRHAWSVVAAAFVIGGLAGYLGGLEDRRSSRWW